MSEHSSIYGVFWKVCCYQLC